MYFIQEFQFQLITQLCKINFKNNFQFKTNSSASFVRFFGTLFAIKIFIFFILIFDVHSFIYQLLVSGFFGSCF